MKYEPILEINTNTNNTGQYLEYIYIRTIEAPKHTNQNTNIYMQYIPIHAIHTNTM